MSDDGSMFSIRFQVCMIAMLDGQRGEERGGGMCAGEELSKVPSVVADATLATVFFSRRFLW